MYNSFYNLTSPPFGLVPDQNFFFGSHGHNRALLYLKFGLQQGEGFIVVTGDVGAGKSTLVSKLVADLDDAMLSTAVLANTQVGAEDALRMILAAFKIQPLSTDKASMLRAFESYLRDQCRARRRVLLIIDEAQALPTRTLEELRMLSNILIDGHSAFQSFLVGQPQLVKLMSRADLEQFRQRIVASCHIGPLAPCETRGYIEHRLTLAGWAGNPVISAEAFIRIHDTTGGIPRRINLLCNRLLLHGALEAMRELDVSAVDEVVADLAQEAIDPVRLTREESAPDRSAVHPSGDLQELNAEVLQHLPSVLTQLDRRLDTLGDTLNRALNLLTAYPNHSGPANGSSGTEVNGNGTETHVHVMKSGGRAKKLHRWIMRR